MSKRPFPLVTVTLDSIVGGGQTIATMDDGRKLFVWGGLPGETVTVQLTKKKSKMAEGIVKEVLQASPDRVDPVDPDSYLSTSPWQVYDFAVENRLKGQLIDEAFALHHVSLPKPASVVSNGVEYGYRNKVEYSWYWNKETEQLDLAFFLRGGKGKFPVEGTALAPDCVNEAARRLRDVLRRRGADAYGLKTVLIRSDQSGQVVMQLYVKDETFKAFSDQEIAVIAVKGIEVIFSNPKSPASVITKRLFSHGTPTLSDKIRGIDFRYATESFFQINLPLYEHALNDISQWLLPQTPVVDMYSGVGTIGLTVTDGPVTMVEINDAAVQEMKENIKALGRTNATALLTPSEKALDEITSDATIILDPPRAGLDVAVVERLLETLPQRLIYLSCNPVTQARDASLLLEGYEIIHQQGYNFFPRTPHIEHLIVLERAKK